MGAVFEAAVLSFVVVAVYLIYSLERNSNEPFAAEWARPNLSL